MSALFIMKLHHNWLPVQTGAHILYEATSTNSGSFRYKAQERRQRWVYYDIIHQNYNFKRLSTPLHTECCANTYSTTVWMLWLEVLGKSLISLIKIWKNTHTHTLIFWRSYCVNDFTGSYENIMPMQACIICNSQMGLTSKGTHSIMGTWNQT